MDVNCFGSGFAKFGTKLILELGRLERVNEHFSKPDI